MDNPTSEHKKKIIAASEKWPPYISLILSSLNRAFTVPVLLAR
ncbi:hypothetical protein [Pseudomonas sp. MWU318]|nr:hypothetical protein [Pseudomonas sp. MWU318]